jgi:hypothetical protein
MEENWLFAASMSLDIKIRAHLTAAALMLGAGVLYCFPPENHSFYPRCIFHALTGWECPGCGGTRAVYHLLHLRLAEAFHYNALLTVVAPFALTWFLVWYAELLFRNRRHKFPLRLPVTVCLYFVVVLFGVVRNLPFSIFG